MFYDERLRETSIYDYEGPVRGELQNGDVLLFRNPRGAIATDGRGVHSHAALFAWHSGSFARRMGRVALCLESREWHGARITLLSDQIRRHPGQIDVFRPKCPPQVKELAVEYALRQCGKGYNYWGIVGCSLLHAPLLKRAFRYFPDTTDTTLSAWDSPKFCSQLVLWSYRKAARKLGHVWDLCPGLGDPWCEPTDLYRMLADSLVRPRLVLPAPARDTIPLSQEVAQCDRWS